MNDLDKALDHVFSLWIRCRGSWKCFLCGRRVNPPLEMLEIPDDLKRPTAFLECSHFWGVGSSSFWTRWHDQCADPACVDCHSKLEKQKHEGRQYFIYKISQLGEHRFQFMSWLSTRTDPMYPQVKEFRLWELISNIGSRGYPTAWLFEKYGALIQGLPPIKEIIK